MTLTAPQPIDEQHEIGAFDFGVPLLDDWLKRRARANQEAARRAPMSSAKSNASSPITLSPPARSILKSLPVASAETCLTLCRSPCLDDWRLRKAFKNTVWTRLDTRRGNPRPASCRSDWHSRNCRACAFAGAKAFYLAVGFEISPLEPLTLMATLADIQAATKSA